MAEGASVQVTVSRDGAVGTSEIDVETLDGSARGGADYASVARRTIAFTNETSQTFPVTVRDDADAEPAETFRLHLSNPGGCAVNPNFSVGPDATVTISASDESGRTPTTAASAPTTRPRPATTASTAAAPGVTPDPGPTPEVTEPAADGLPETTERPTTTEVEGDDVALAGEDETPPGGGWVIAALAVVALGAVIGGGGWWTWRRRAHPSG